MLQMAIPAGAAAATMALCSTTGGPQALILMQNHFPSVQRDTRAWQYQVWISFGLAASLCAIGLAWLPGQRLEQAFMVMGYVFSLSAAFVLAKFVRDQQRGGPSGDTPMWKLVVWGGFAVAMGLTGWGLLGMQISPTYQAFLGVSWLYLVTTAFTLAKMLRDRHEADLAEARLAAQRAASRETN
ncbi:hypothetical protein GCM10027082_03070 [Comamonas humi]